MRSSLDFGLRTALSVAGGLLCLASGVARPAIPPAFRPDVLAQLDAAITSAVASRKPPGAVLWIERNGIIHQRAYGLRVVEPVGEAMTMDTVFDVASLTKVLATAPAVLLLIERGQIQLDAPVRRYLPGFNGPGTGAVTVRHLLTHTSGLLVGISGADFQDYPGALALALQQRPSVTPGTMFQYCDANFLLLGEVVRRVAEQPLDEFVSREIYRQVGMNDTGFLPPASLRHRIAPTLRTPDGILRGTVHDPTARRMGGVAGHAGVFTTAADLARFARLMLNEGELDGVRVFRPETVRLMTSVQSPAKVPARRGLGWDIDSGYSRPRGLLFPLGSYGHTGWTGACLWIDPFSKTFVILLTNRLHPVDRGGITDLYAAVGTLAARAVEDFDFRKVPGALPFRTNFINWGAATNWLGPVAGSDRPAPRPPD
jgi:CubicO group peptidase (beta-lactamase class C family)